MVVDLVTQRVDLAGTNQPVGHRLIERLTKLCGVGADGEAVPDRPRHRGHRQIILLCHVLGLQHATVEAIELASGSAWVVVSRDRQLDSRRVHIGQAMQDQGRLMGDHPPAQCPGDRLRQLVVFSPGQDRHPIDTARHPFQATPGRHQPKLSRVDSEIASIAGGHVPVLLNGSFEKLIANHVLERIKMIRISPTAAPQPHLSDRIRRLRGVDYQAIESLRGKHPAWRLLRANNASLILSFLGDYFVENNRGASSASQVAAALDDHLYTLNSLSADDQERRYPKDPLAYLEDWAATEAGFLRRFYPAGIDEVHYEVTPALEKAYAWVESLRARSFVGTESRLHTIVELLRQIVHGSEADPQVRLTELHRQRDAIDAQIAAVEAGQILMMDETGVRDRYQQFTATARDLLSDFREVEENFRGLDRAARERIAAWDGSKGELLADLVGSRSDITGSDQGRNFQAFYDFLLSESRQDELSDLLAKVRTLESVDEDRRVEAIHHDWAEAAERAQRTVRQISEQLRRFLDDQVWLENRRVLDLVRAIEAQALELREDPPDVGLDVDEPGVEILLPFERPLYAPPTASEVESLIPPAEQSDLDADLLFSQTYIDSARLAANIRTILPERSSALLTDIIDMYPIEQGAAELVAYLALSDDDLTVEMDDSDETLVEIDRPDGRELTRRVRLAKVTVTRS